MYIEISKCLLFFSNTPIQIHVAENVNSSKEFLPQNIGILQNIAFFKKVGETQPNGVFLRKHPKHCKLAIQIDPGILKNDVRWLNSTSTPFVFG